MTNSITSPFPMIPIFSRPRTHGVTSGHRQLRFLFGAVYIALLLTWLAVSVL
ncbi:hypothetical protein Terro_2558 [Terriglobus roseus DSM 18391]|uniref:Uncharacterized protein n=1 Tax=Terriglobus roseus (strain DSM 18391 / NRRL B-41598 / KBS 63) TaxID=926566 RepID=I3ZGU2_TERRK|nr:hypothetical protein Terro_2194 [Terriglobus roseus DSM 18391]AFL88802.1 hypothetical protein Terro_2558 [Terriglobus roseus DSM 18391]